MVTKRSQLGWLRAELDREDFAPLVLWVHSAERFPHAALGRERRENSVASGGIGPRSLAHLPPSGSVHPHALLGAK